MLKSKLNFMVLLAGVSLFSMHAHAQVERFPGLIDKKVPDVGVPPAYSLDREEQKPFEEPPVLKNVEDPDKVITTLQSVSFEGNTVLDTEKLNEVVASYIGKQFTNGDLAKLKYDVKRAFYDNGYILVRVVTQPQDFANGELKVSIYEAKIGEVIIKGNAALNNWVAENLAKKAKTGKVVDETTLESMISDLNDLYGVSASVNLTPGKVFSSSDLNLLINSAKEDTNSVSVDNYGSDLTGEIVAAAHLEKSNLFKFGEKLNLDVQRSEDDLWSVGGGAILPTGIKNLKLETSYLHSENEIGGRLEGLKASGETDAFSLALSSKLINTLKRQAVVRFGYEGRKHESFLADVDDTKDNLRKIFAESSYIYRGLATLVYGSARLSKGLDIFGASEKGDASASRARGEPEAWIFEPTLLVNSRPFSSEGTIKALLRGQLSSNILLSSDLMTAGGYGGIRGFNVAQEAAESGYSFSVEYNHVLPLGNDKFELKAGPFLDGGALYNRVAGSLEDTHFYSTGLGLEAKAKIVPVGDTVLRLDWAHPIGNYRSNQVSDDTFYIRLKQEF